MRKININRIKPGEINGKTINTYTQRRQLLSSGMEIKPEYINRLNQLGIKYIYVEDEVSEGIVLQEMISEEIHIQAKECVLNATKAIQKDDLFEDSREVTSAVNAIIDDMAKSQDLAVTITDIRATDDYTFGHSVSVCALSIILGRAWGLNDIQLRDLGIGAIMHDVGKTKIPIEILNKPSKLTDEEMEIIKTHTTLGFEILRKCDTLNRNTAYVALGHHERYDGTGYPNGFVNKDINIFSRIVSIVDVFDAMCSDRVYHKGMDTNKVINYLNLMSNKHYDGEIVKKFTEKIIIYPNGTSVILNTKEKGIVVSSNLRNPERPIVRICVDPTGKFYKKFHEIDLSTNLQYSIFGVCDAI